MKYGLLGLFLAGALALPAWAANEEKPTVVPVTKAPFHLFTFQDENMPGIKARRYTAPWAQRKRCQRRPIPQRTILAPAE